MQMYRRFENIPLDHRRCCLLKKKKTFRFPIIFDTINIYFRRSLHRLIRYFRRFIAHGTWSLRRYVISRRKYQFIVGIRITFQNIRHFLYFTLRVHEWPIKSPPIIFRHSFHNIFLCFYLFFARLVLWHGRILEIVYAENRIIILWMMYNERNLI